MEMKSHGKRMKDKVHLELNDAALQSAFIVFPSAFDIQRQ